MADTKKPSTVIYLASDGMGRGDDDLGRDLMGPFFDTLAHHATDISHVLCVNRGVLLALEDSPVIEDMRCLANTGVTILCCTTCLRHFDALERLGVGSASTMMEIVAIQLAADRILAP